MIKCLDSSIQCIVRVFLGTIQRTELMCLILYGYRNLLLVLQREGLIVFYTGAKGENDYVQSFYSWLYCKFCFADLVDVPLDSV